MYLPIGVVTRDSPAAYRARLTIAEHNTTIGCDQKMDLVMSTKFLIIWLFGMVVMAMLINMKGVLTGNVGDGNRFVAKVTNTKPQCTNFSGTTFGVSCRGPGPDDGVVQYQR